MTVHTTLTTPRLLISNLFLVLTIKAPLGAISLANTTDLIRLPKSMARVYADVNALLPRAYWDYDSVNISWGLLENYEVVRKIGTTLFKILL